MGRALTEPARPPMWWIDEAKGGAATRFVSFGGNRIAIRDIVSMSLEEVREPSADGLFLKGTVFVCVAAMFAYHVFEGGGRERFLIGMAFLAMLGTAAVIEASRLAGTRHYELALILADGSRRVFTSTDRADIQALALRLAAEGAARV